MGDLSSNFSFGEFTVSKDYSELASRIQLSNQDRQKIFILVRCLLQPLRDDIGVPIYVLSGKRSIELNQRVGGTSNSDHLFQGYSAAIDFTTEDLESLWAHIHYFLGEKKSCLVKQLIRYYDGNFVHLSLVDSTDKNCQVLYCMNRAQRIYLTSLYDVEKYLRKG